MKFKGGKGIASTMGLFWLALACETWWFIFIGLLLFVMIFTYIAITEWGSMGSLIGVSLFTIWQAVIFIIRYDTMLTNGYVIVCFMLLLLLNLLTWLAHHKNLYKLMAGEEHHTSIKKMLHKKKSQ
jgi:glycerol-3-phosphate acyltransferase PlsY